MFASGGRRAAPAFLQFHSPSSQEDDDMTPSTQKIIQYLDEAHATEVGLVRVLQSQIAMTPRGSYRTLLERHLTETRGHARKVEARLRELGRRGNPLQFGIGAAETVLAQGLAVA